MFKTKLADILTSHVIGVAPETTVAEAMQIMKDKDISSILVLKENKPIGIFTERNVVMFAARRQSDLFDHQIRDLMSSPVLTAHMNTDIYTAYNKLASKGIRHLVIVDDDSRSVGMVTLSNLMEHLGYDYFVEMKKVSQTMTKIVFTMSEETLLQQALNEMAEKSVSCLVVAEDKRPLGIITERDVARLLVSNHNVSELKVKDVMSSPVETVQWDTPLHSAVTLMKQKSIRRLVVVDQEGMIEGLSTQSDIVKGLEGKYIETLNEIIREKDIAIKTTTKDLAEKTIYLDNILRSSIDNGIIATDLELRIVYFNPAAEEILGCRAREVIGRSIKKLQLKGNMDFSQFDEIAEAIENNSSHTFLLELENDTALRIIRARAAKIRDTGRKSIGFSLMLNDITERKRAEAELRQVHEGLEKMVQDRTRELGNAIEGIIQAMALTIESRDPYTSGHQRRVAKLAAAIARELGHSSKTVEGIYMAGLIHDIGKIRVPSDILCSPAVLTDVEYAILKPHPQIGYEILKGIEFPWPIAQIVLQHHERMDGSGYTQGLSGDQILEEARIVAVADVVEAMSSHRPYRPALGIDIALEEISKNKGTRYDAQVVDACLRLFKEKGYTLHTHFGWGKK